MVFRFMWMFALPEKGLRSTGYYLMAHGRPNNALGAFRLRLEALEFALNLPAVAQAEASGRLGRPECRVRGFRRLLGRGRSKPACLRRRSGQGRGGSDPSHDLYKVA